MSKHKMRANFATDESRGTTLIGGESESEACTCGGHSHGENEQRANSEDDSENYTAGTMRDYKQRKQGTVSSSPSRSRSGGPIRFDDSPATGEGLDLRGNGSENPDDYTSGTLAGYRNRKEAAGARPVRPIGVGKKSLRTNSLTAAREERDAETIRVVGVIDDTGDLRGNSKGRGRRPLYARGRDANGESERVRITDAPDADPVFITGATPKGGGTMRDYRNALDKDAAPVVVVNPEEIEGLLGGSQ